MVTRNGDAVTHHGTCQEIEQKWPYVRASPPTVLTARFGVRAVVVDIAQPGASRTNVEAERKRVRTAMMTDEERKLWLAIRKEAGLNCRGRLVVCSYARSIRRVP
jgi:hypothetical protein